MGLYPIVCSCGKPFVWFSGLNHQLCEECYKKVSPTAKEIVESFEKFEEKVPIKFIVATNNAIKDK